MKSFTSQADMVKAAPCILLLFFSWRWLVGGFRFPPRMGLSNPPPATERGFEEPKSSSNLGVAQHSRLGGYAGFSLLFHLPGFHFGCAFLTHSHLFRVRRFGHFLAVPGGARSRSCWAHTPNVGCELTPKLRCRVKRLCRLFFGPGEFADAKADGLRFLPAFGARGGRPVGSSAGTTAACGTPPAPTPAPTAAPPPPGTARCRYSWPGAAWWSSRCRGRKGGLLGTVQKLEHVNFAQKTTTWLVHPTFGFAKQS